MAEVAAPTQTNFHEWMVTKALSRYLGLDKADPDYPRRMDWLFAVKARTSDGSATLKELCGFDWREGADGGAERALTREHRGNIPEDEFGKVYWGMTADFSFWTDKRQRQLLVEAKGVLTPSKKDRAQADRYFSYVKAHGSEGAIVYFVPQPANWLKMLEEAREGSNGKLGVVGLEEQIIPEVVPDLIDVIGEELVKTAGLLKQALGLRKPAQAGK